MPDTTQTVDTNTQAERDSIAAEARGKEAEAQVHQNTLDDLREKLARLDEAYAAVNSVKDSVKDHKTFYFKKCLRYYNEDNRKWVGSTYNNLESEYNGTTLPSVGTYIGEIDNILDAIGNLRTKYENDILDETTILSGLWKTINYLWDKWKNFCN